METVAVGTATVVGTNRRDDDTAGRDVGSRECDGGGCDDGCMSMGVPSQGVASGSSCEGRSDHYRPSSTEGLCLASCSLSAVKIMHSV